MLEKFILLGNRYMHAFQNEDFRILQLFHFRSDKESRMHNLSRYIKSCDYGKNKGETYCCKEGSRNSMNSTNG